MPLRPSVNYGKIRTVVRAPEGWYGSERTWVNPSIAFQCRHEFPEYGKWEYLGDNGTELAMALSVDTAKLPRANYAAIALAASVWMLV